MNKEILKTSGADVLSSRNNLKNDLKEGGVGVGGVKAHSNWDNLYTFLKLPRLIYIMLRKSDLNFWKVGSILEVLAA